MKAVAQQLVTDGLASNPQESLRLEALNILNPETRGSGKPDRNRAETYRCRAVLD